MEVYFCGTDLYNCLPIVPNPKSNLIQTMFNEPMKLSHVSKIVYGHFYAVYQKKDSSSWFIKSFGSSESEIFQSESAIKQVAVGSNTIIGLSEMGKLYRIVMDVDEKQYDLTTTVTVSEPNPPPNHANVVFSKVTSNDLCIFGLESSPEGSRIYKIEESLECIAEFPGKQMVDLVAGHGHFVVRSDTGAVWNWGYSGRSELASCSEISSMTVCDTPQRVAFFDDLTCIVTKIVCGGWHTLALTSDGDIYSWGWNESGQLGHDSSVISKSEPYPVDLGSAEDPVIDIAAGSRHSVAILKSGLVYSWGRNLEGQGGTGHINSSPKPELMVRTWEGNGVACEAQCGKWSSFVFCK